MSEKQGKWKIIKDELFLAGQFVLKKVLLLYNGHNTKERFKNKKPPKRGSKAR